MINWKRIIRRMLQYARRIWSICFSALGGILLVSVQVLIFLDGKCYQGLVFYILGFLALISLAIGIVPFIYDTKTTFRQNHLFKLSQQLRDYLVDMKRLDYDFKMEHNQKRIDELLDVFKELCTKIEGFIKCEMPNELEYWGGALSGQYIQLGIAIKESIKRLEDIISKNTTTCSNTKIDLKDENEGKK